MIRISDCSYILFCIILIQVLILFILVNVAFLDDSENGTQETCSCSRRQHCHTLILIYFRRLEKSRSEMGRMCQTCGYIPEAFSQENGKILTVKGVRNFTTLP